MVHALPVLAYKNDELEPYISKKAVDFHYGVHHQTYLVNLNNLIPGTRFEDSSLEEIVKESDGKIYNNGAQVWNHSFYFTALSPKPTKKPEGKLLQAINNEYGSFELFIERITKVALSLFGSGWVWVVKKHDGSLNIIPESNAGNPLLLSLKPILNIDVWEHAYYLDYQNRRADYIKNFWKVLDWKIISERYDKIK